VYTKNSIKNISLIESISIIIGLGLVGTVSNIETGSAQQAAFNPSKPTITTKWDDFFSSYPIFELDSNKHLVLVEVLYESDKTVALKSHYSDIIWEAVNFVKSEGLKIDNFQAVGDDIWVVLSK
jgi:hypothetical protein